MSFVRTTAVNKILALSKRKKVIQGGSSAGKTFAILSILIDKATKKAGLEISVVSESIPHLKKGALKDFIKIMKLTGRWFESRYNATDRVYKFANGSYIEFFSPESILGARRNILYINEAINVSYEDYHQLLVRTSDEVYIDFNPSNEFWVHTELLNESDTDYLILKYTDNESLPNNVVSDFMQAQSKASKEKAEGIDGYWSNWCRVYIDGEVGLLQGAVFQFKLCDEIPSDAKQIGLGLDFGFTNDPAALIDVKKQGENLYLDELIYRTGLTNSDLINEMTLLNVSKHVNIIADSAEPKSIEDLKRAGYSINGAKKGEDSIRSSIDTLQAYTIYITKRSLNLIKEFRMYKWQTDQSGKPTGKPIDAFNHGIDSVRYVALNKLNRGTDYNYTFRSM